MPARATWTGFLNLSLVSVPVRAYSASNSAATIRLNQLHAQCNSRINLKTVCPSCGEVPRTDLVKGYEYSKDQYVVIDLDELEKLRTHDESKAIQIDKFIASDQIDPLFYSDTTYYLLPDGAPGQKPYRLLMKAMENKGLYCVAHVVLHNKEQLVLVRPYDGLLSMTVLKYSEQIKPATTFHEELNDAELSKEEFRLAETLVDETIEKEFQLSAYQNKYHDRLKELIDAKIEGKEIVAAPQTETPTVINLMDALQASVEKARGGSPLKAKSAAKSESKSGANHPAATKKSASKALLAKKLAKSNRKSGKGKKTG